MRSFPPCTLSPVIMKRDTTFCNGLGLCGGTWVKSTGKYTPIYHHFVYFYSATGARSSSRFFFPLISALTLWEHDNSLTIALDVCKAFFEPIKFLITFFPGPGGRHISHTSFYSWPAQLIYESPAQQRRLLELQARVFAAETAGGYVSTPSPS